MTLESGSKLGPYEIVDLIGAGGMGEVYRAHDPRVGRDVAIKVSTEQFTDRFEREIRAVASLNHSNICILHDVGPNYLVMELIEGPTLADRIKQGAIPLEESLEIALQIADALEAAHEKGIVHRDLKPANIKIKPDGTVKVLDFGLAKVRGTPVVSSENSPTLSVAQTAAGVILGTAAYMSPEQAKGKTVDKRTDIWAFGVVLYEMITGKRLFEGDTVSDTLAAVLTRDPEWERAPAKVRRLLRSCLQRNPKQRLADISDAKLLLEVTLEPSPARKPWPAWAIAAVLVITTAALSFLYFREKAPSILEPMRFEITPPTNLDWGLSFAVSPDGRHLAFAGRDSDGFAHLWVRSLNSLEARALPGTESPHIPPFFWSPDSRFIAFDAGGKLKKIDISGGPAQTICDLQTNAVGGSWNRDGEIIFGTLEGGGGIRRVPASGGIASPLIFGNKAQQTGVRFFPTFLPDGRHFLYWQNLGSPGTRGIYIGSLDSKAAEQDSQRLLATSFGAVYVPSQDSGLGQVLFLREQTLMSQRFDDKRLELVGDAIPVVEQVGAYTSSGFFSASTNGILVYQSGSLAQYMQATWFDRQGKVLGKVGEPGVYYGLALSSDGAKAAVSFLATTFDSQDLWLLDFARPTSTRFTFGKSFNRMPVWSPDASRIIFASNREGVFDLYEKISSGVKDEEQLLKSDDNKFPTSWSRDGRFLLYSASNPKTKADLWVLPLRGDHRPIPFLSTDFNESDGHFSPDMRWVAYTSDESGRNEIFVRVFSQSSGASAETGGKWQVSIEGGTGSRWRADGRELYYRAPDGKVMGVEVKSGAAFQQGALKTLFLAPPEGTAAYQFIPLPIWDVTSDGNRFLLPITPAEATPTPFKVVLNWQAGLKK